MSGNAEAYFGGGGQIQLSTTLLLNLRRHHLTLGRSYDRTQWLQVLSHQTFFHFTKRSI